ncbi:MAG: hypothetical protein RIF41_29445, partial [Polyangiaceae bacterium]
MSAPTPWVLELLARLREDPVIDLDRVDQPSHVLVHAVYLGVGSRTAVVEYALISGPPPPSSVPFGGRFEDAPREVLADGERPWFVFHESLSFERNIARFRAHARGSITALGKRAAPPVLDE